MLPILLVARYSHILYASNFLQYPYRYIPRGTASLVFFLTVTEPHAGSYRAACRLGKSHALYLSVRLCIRDRNYRASTLLYGTSKRYSTIYSTKFSIRLRFYLYILVCIDRTNLVHVYIAENHKLDRIRFKVPD